MAMRTEFLKGQLVSGLKSSKESDPELEETQVAAELEGRSVSVETSDLLEGLWERASSWSVLLPGGVHVYQVTSLSQTTGLDLKVITNFILTSLLFRSSSARHKEELQRARAIERAIIRAEYRARIHHAFQNKATQIAAEEVLRLHHQASSTGFVTSPSLTVGTGAVMAGSGLSVYPIFTFPRGRPSPIAAGA